MKVTKEVELDIAARVGGPAQSHPRISKLASAFKPKSPAQLAGPVHHSPELARNRTTLTPSPSIVLRVSGFCNEFLACWMRVVVQGGPTVVQFVLTGPGHLVPSPRTLAHS